AWFWSGPDRLRGGAALSYTPHGLRRFAADGTAFGFAHVADRPRGPRRSSQRGETDACGWNSAILKDSNNCSAASTRASSAPASSGSIGGGCAYSGARKKHAAN